MELVLLDSDLKAVDILDIFDSLIWTDRFCGYGDFEVVMPISSKIVSYLSEDRYLSFTESEHLMIIENLSIHTDIESGNKVIVKGRSLETILDRRIVWTQTTFYQTNLQNGIEQLLLESAMGPDITDRAISRLEFEESDDPNITDLVFDGQYFGEFVGQVITDICLSKGIGFKLTLTDTGNFLFKLYAGTDRSYDQIDNPYVIFSPKFENMINSDYIETDEFLRTVSLVAGEGEGSARQTTIVESPSGAEFDLWRREMFTDAKGLSKTTQTGTLTDEEYLAQLRQKGMEDLSKNVFIKTFEGQVDTTLMYVFGEDYAMGDIVQVENEYGHVAKSKVTEVIHSQDTSGFKIFPTFTAVA